VTDAALHPRTTTQASTAPTRASWTPGASSCLVSAGGRLDLHLGCTAALSKPAL